MPKMHAVTLLTSGVLLGAGLGYVVARMRPWLAGREGHSQSQAGGLSWLSSTRRWVGHRFRRRSDASTSTATHQNRAFEAYKQDVLARLQDEQAQFEAFLSELRMAKDQQEFDAFLANQNRR